LVVNNGNPFTFTGDDPDWWTVIGEVGTDPEVTEVGSGEDNTGTGTGSINMFASAISNTPRIVRSALLTIGKRYQIDVVLSNDSGVGTGVLQTDSFVDNLVFSGVGSFSGEGVADSAVLSLRCIGTAPFDVTIDSISVKEANPLNADHVGVTVAQPGPTGNLSVLYTPPLAYTDCYSAALDSVFNPPLFSISIAAKMSGAGVWTDNTLRVLLNWQADANNYVRLSKNTSNQLQWDYMAGGTLESVTLAVTPSEWFMMTITVNEAGNMTAYYNDAVAGTPQAIAGTWAGGLNSATTVIGALNTTPNNGHDGWLTLPMYVRAYELALSDVRALAKSVGV
jgi:hypothetical protein